MGELGARADRHNVFTLALPHGDIKVTDVSSILLVEARVGHAHDVLQSLVISEEAARFRSETTFAAGIRSAFDSETGRRPLRKARGGLPEEHCVGISQQYGKQQLFRQYMGKRIERVNAGDVSPFGVRTMFRFERDAWASNIL